MAGQNQLASPPLKPYCFHLFNQPVSKVIYYYNYQMGQVLH